MLVYQCRDTVRRSWIIIAGFLSSSICARLVPLVFPALPSFIPLISFHLIYASSLFCWALAVRQRVLNPHIFIGLEGVLAMILVLQALLLFKNCALPFPKAVFYAEILEWTVFAGVAIFSLYAAVYPDSMQREKTPLYFRVEAVLTVLVAVAFAFSRAAGVIPPPKGGSLSPYSLFYVNAPYTLYCVWMFLLLMQSFILLKWRCTIPAGKKWGFVPQILVVLCIAVKALLFALSDRDILSASTIICPLLVAAWEISIQVGLLPANSSYADFVSVCTLAAQFTDNEHRVVQSSAGARALTEEQMEKAPRTPLLLDPCARLSAAKICGGWVYWEDNLTVLACINRSLADISARLSEENELLQAENNLNARDMRAEEKNRLYNGISSTLSPQLEEIDRLLGAADCTSGQAFHFDIARAGILTAYVKRFSNLVLLSSQSVRLHAFELENSLRESLEFLSFYGARCLHFSEASGTLPGDVVLYCYRAFEALAEQTLPCLTSMMIKLKAEEGALALQIELLASGAAPSLPPDMPENVRAIREKDGEAERFRILYGSVNRKGDAA